jgi:hypothetical protein
MIDTLSRGARPRGFPRTHSQHYEITDFGNFLLRRTHCRGNSWGPVREAFRTGDSSGGKIVGSRRGAGAAALDSPRGPITIDPETRDIIQDVYIRKVERKDGELYNIESRLFPR